MIKYIEAGPDIWIELPCGSETVISKEDKWILDKFPVIGITGSASKYVFVERGIETEYSVVRERIYLHRIIVGLKSNSRMNADHKDRDRLNNRRSNLRICNAWENMANTGPKNGKKFKGVFHDTSRKLAKPFSSYIDARGAGLKKRQYLGRFKTAEEAARAYDKASRQVYGEFAYQNFPKDI